MKKRKGRIKRKGRRRGGNRRGRESQRREKKTEDKVWVLSARSLTAHLRHFLSLLLDRLLGRDNATVTNSLPQCHYYRPTCDGRLNEGGGYPAPRQPRGKI